MRPVASIYPVTLGYRQKMRSRPSYIHRGIDFGTPRGTPVVATVTGAVVHVGYGGLGGTRTTGFGWHLVLKTAGIYHVYAHLTEGSSAYQRGQTVKQGKVLGKSGATGNVTGPHHHYGELTAYSYTADRTPQFLDDTEVERPKSSGPWFDLTLWPLAGFDAVYGKANWDKLESKIVAELKRIGSDVYALTEVPEPRRAAFGKKLDKAGYRLDVSQDGRTIVTRKTMKVGRSKIITLAEKGSQNDDKQVVMLEMWPTPSPNAIVLAVGHLESDQGDAFDAVRVTQGKQERKGVEAFAETCGVPDDRIVFADDENSRGWVLEKAYQPDYVDVFDQAFKVQDETLATITGWDGAASPGARTDRIKVSKDRPVESAQLVLSTVKKKLSDHAPTRVVIGKK